MERFSTIKKLFAIILICCLFGSILPLHAYAANTYVINGKLISHTDVAWPGEGECWKYVNALYKKIWGVNFNSNFAGDSSTGYNMLRNLSDSKLTLTEDHLKEYVTNAALGSTIRICNSGTLHGNDSSGHSQLIVQKDINGFTIFESLSSGRYEKYFTWSQYCESGYLGGKYSYIKYIKWPSAPAYSGSNITPTDVTNPDNYKYPDPQTTGTFYRTSPTMKDSGENTYVSWIQAVLYQLGYSINIDGSYGQQTENIVKQFQNDNGLEVDGAVGVGTKTKLLELWNEKKAADSHTCNKNSSSYQAAHPHYLVYKCSVCGKEQVDTTVTQRMNSCNSCLPEKSSLTVSAGTSLDYTSFSWSVAGGADCYELIVYRNGEDTPLHWLYNLTSNNYTLQLSAGEYIAYVASINNDLIDSSCWWVYSDKVEFSVSDGGDFAPVVGSEYNGSRYELYNVRIPWYEAKAKCEELGGHLVVITSELENEAVGELVSQGGRHSYWMGMSDNDTEGMWVSVTGEVLTYENWMEGEPNNQNDEDYAVIRNVDGKTWNDAGDTYHNVLAGFICEYETEDNTDDGHIHDYYVTDSIPSTCTEYGYKVYTCDCGDTYTETSELSEHQFYFEYPIITDTSACVDFVADYCRRCCYIENCKLIYPDGIEKDLYLSVNPGDLSSYKDVIEMYKDLLFDADLNAFISTSDEKTIGFVWSEVCIEEATADEAVSTDDESFYYVLSIYKGTELVEEIKTFLPSCEWKFRTDGNHKAVITTYNKQDEIVNFSNVYSLDFMEINADWWGYYGDVDLNGKVNVKDATLVQKYLANMVNLDKHPLKQADVNSDGKLNIRDATVIQKYCAKLDVDSRIGCEYWDGYTAVSGIVVELA